MKNIFLILLVIASSAYAGPASKKQQDVMATVIEAMVKAGERCRVTGTPHTFDKDLYDFHGSDGLQFTMDCFDQATLRTESVEFIVVDSTQQVDGFKLVEYGQCDYSGQILSQNNLNLKVDCSTDPQD